jgi:hypothetical protein
MATEFDNIGSLQPSGPLLGTEQIEALTTALAQIGGAPNCRLTVDQIKQYVTGFTNAGAVAFTIPNLAFPIGTTLEFEQAGLGIVTVSPVGGSGVVINSRGGIFTTAGQFAVAALKKVGATTWTLTGDLA